MYTEEYEEKGFPILRFILKVLILAIIVLLIIWYVPKLFNITKNKKQTTKEPKTTIVSKKCKEDNKKCNTKEIKALSKQIFSNNIERMKDAAISYYTDEHLPKDVNTSDKITLKSMIEMKLITPLTDKNNKKVDVEKSYAKITKTDTEYILKVNLKDSEKEDYILIHLGCYSYCKTNICEKNKEIEENTSIKASKEEEKNQTIVNNNSSSNNTITNNNINSNSNNNYTVVVTPKEEPKENIKCQNINGNFYDKNGNITTEYEYIKSCQAPKCEIVNGYYFGKDGNNVTKSRFDKECNTQSAPKPSYKCEKKNGKFYDKNGNTTSEINYIKSCQAPKCEIVNGYYFGKDGNNINKETFDKECKEQPKEEKEYVYEYSKTIEETYSNWSDWSNWTKTDCSTKEINCNDNDSTCLIKLQTLKRKEKIGTYKKTYSTTRDIVKQTGSYKQKSCSKYNYVEINKKLYATTTTYTTINTIASTTKASTGSWTYNGRQSYSNPPRDTATTHYVFAGADYSYCNDTCTTLPNYYYDSYSYEKSLTSVSSTTEVVASSTSYKASCGEYVIKTIPIYSTITITEKASREEPLYGDVCYKSTKSREKLTSGTTQTKWSSYNDQSLLNDGWIYTGRKKVK